MATLAWAQARGRLASRWAKFQNFAHALKTRAKRAVWRSKDGWRQLTAGLEAA